MLSPLLNGIRRGRNFRSPRTGSAKRFSRPIAGFIERKARCIRCRWLVRPRLTASGAIMTRIAPCVIAALTLGLSACANPYDPVERGLAGAFGVRLRVLRLEQRRVAGRERPLER